MLIISDDCYFRAGLSRLLHDVMPPENDVVIFDAGGQCVYVMSASFIHDIRSLDALSILLTRRYSVLPKNAPATDYIRTISQVCREPTWLKASRTLSRRETDVLRLMACRYFVHPVPAVPEGKMKGWSFHKRNALEKLRLKNGTIFYRVLVSWCGLLSGADALRGPAALCLLRSRMEQRHRVMLTHRAGPLVSDLRVKRVSAGMRTE